MAPVRFSEWVFGVKFAAVVEQWRRAMVVGAALYFTDKNNVVAFVVAAAIKAFKGGSRAIEQRGPCSTGAVLNASKAIDTLGGKLLCQTELFCAQDVDCIV